MWTRLQARQVTPSYVSLAVLGPVVSKPTLDRNTHIRAKKDDCRHFAPIAGLRRLHLT